MKPARLLILVVVLLSSGCSNLNKPPFAVGIYAVSKAQLPEVAAEGFDLVVGPASKEFLDEAKSYGARVMATGAELDREKPLTPAQIISLDRHAALSAWYLVDEPDLHNIAPKQVQRANALIKKSARKPTIVVLSSGGAVEKYSRCSDYLGVDWYPVPWAPISTFGREMKLARLGAAGKPFYAILQAFSWEALPEMVRTDQKLREPSYEELRCMAYLAMSQGARGVLFYSYSEPRWKLKEHATLWTGVERLVVDLREDAPVFQNRISWWPLETSHKGKSMFNEIYDARMAVSLFEVKKKVADVEPGFYFVIINTTRDELEFSFEIPFNPVRPLSSFHSTEQPLVNNGWLKKRYGSFEVAIYGPVIPAKRPDWMQ